MTPERLLRVALSYLLALTVVSCALYRVIRLDRTRAPARLSIVSVWQAGVRTARRVVSGDATHVLEAEGRAPGATRVVEPILDSARILPLGRLVFGASIAPARDGVSVSFNGRTAYLTPDDLLKLEAYESTLQLGPALLVLGVDVDKVLQALASELHATPNELFRHGQFRRFAVPSSAPYPRQLGADQITPAALRSSLSSAARYLARNQHPDGSFRYEVNAVTGGDEPGYNYPRHAGATYFLARAAHDLHDPRLARAAHLGAVFLRDHATLRCGEHACIGEGDEVDLGAAALAVLTYAELVEGGAPEFRDAALDLAGFLRAQQRSNGDFQHLYSVKEQHPVDIQLEYYTGEAAFALATVQRLSGDAKDLDAASRALSFLVKRSRWYVGAHYFWAAEHWTCQALAELWERAPDRQALQFCLAWQAANREVQLTLPGQYDGGISRGPFVSPRLTPLASRMEAAVATLATARKAGVPIEEQQLLETEIRHGFAFLLRYQYAPGPTHLMPDPRAVAGGFPGSPIDLHVRIDYPQHAGGAIARYLELEPGP